MFSKFLFGKSASGEQAAPKSSENCADTAVGCEFIDLDIALITTNPFQPRKNFSEEALSELASSIKEYGVIQPLVVRRTETGY